MAVLLVVAAVEFSDGPVHRTGHPERPPPTRRTVLTVSTVRRVETLAVRCFGEGVAPMGYQAHGGVQFTRDGGVRIGEFGVKPSQAYPLHFEAGPSTPGS